MISSFQWLFYQKPKPFVQSEVISLPAPLPGVSGCFGGVRLTHGGAISMLKLGATKKRKIATIDAKIAQPIPKRTFCCSQFLVKKSRDLTRPRT